VVAVAAAAAAVVAEVAAEAAVALAVLYDMRCYFNMRSKANMSQLNLPHGTDN